MDSPDPNHNGNTNNNINSHNHNHSNSNNATPTQQYHQHDLDANWGGNANAISTGTGMMNHRGSMSSITSINSNSIHDHHCTANSNMNSNMNSNSNMNVNAMQALQLLQMQQNQQGQGGDNHNIMNNNMMMNNNMTHYHQSPSHNNQNNNQNNSNHATPRNSMLMNNTTSPSPSINNNNNNNNNNDGMNSNVNSNTANAALNNNELLMMMMMNNSNGGNNNNNNMNNNMNNMNNQANSNFQILQNAMQNMNTTTTTNGGLDSMDNNHHHQMMMSVMSNQQLYHGGGMNNNDINHSNNNDNHSNNNDNNNSGDGGGGNTATEGQLLLCASCDRCRARKTKCDGLRPCTNCSNRFKKQNKIVSIDGVDYAEFDCNYSPAKRRGPIPGKSGQVRKANDMMPNQHHLADNVYSIGNDGGVGGVGNANATLMNMAGMGGGAGNQFMDEQARGGGGGGMGMGMGGYVQNSPMGAQQQGMTMNNNNNNNNNDTTTLNAADELKQMLALQQQLLIQQQQLQEHQRQQGMIQQLASMAGIKTDLLNSAGVAGVAGAGGAMGASNASGMMGSALTASPNVNNNNNSNSSNNNQGALQLLQQYHNQAPIDNSSNNAASSPFQVLSSQSQPSPSQYSQQNQVAAMASMQDQDQDRSTKRAHTATTTGANKSSYPTSLASHLPLLELNHPDGVNLRSYYELSINDVLNLPPIPTDEQYCARLSEYNIFCDPKNLPMYDQSALQASRFAELALGALANNQAPLALELSNASVMCLRNCVDEPSHTSCIYDVARAYLLHGIFRSYRGDLVRYFKYRRVCLSHVSQLRGEPNVNALVAAISFHDSWVYMIHNANEDNVPDIDDVLPRPNNSTCGTSCSDAVAVAEDPANQNWIQGAPSIFLNNEAPAINRSLDALACAVRSCCDHANTSFEDMAKEAGVDLPADAFDSSTATTKAVMANENELCSRNIVLSAQSLLNQHSGMSKEKTKKHGIMLLVLGMDAFLDSGEEENMGGFTDNQIKNLLKVCDILIKNPLLLYSPGPLYHMASNAAVMLCHLLNGMHAGCNAGAGSSSSSGGVEGVLFDEVLDSFMAVRKLLNIHRKCLPVRLRCHGIPRPSIGPFKKSSTPEAPFIDLGDTLMCGSRGCQGFVLMGCSPCVAAERSMSAARDQAANEGSDADDAEFQRELGDLGDDFDLDDETLFNVLSRIVSS